MEKVEPTRRFVFSYFFFFSVTNSSNFIWLILKTHRLSKVNGKWESVIGTEFHSAKYFPFELFRSLIKVFRLREYDWFGELHSVMHFIFRSLIIFSEEVMVSTCITLILLVLLAIPSMKISYLLFSSPFRHRISYFSNDGAS